MITFWTLFKWILLGVLAFIAVIAVLSLAVFLFEVIFAELQDLFARIEDKFSKPEKITFKFPNPNTNDEQENN